MTTSRSLLIRRSRYVSFPNKSCGGAFLDCRPRPHLRQANPSRIDMFAAVRLGRAGRNRALLVSLRVPAAAVTIPQPGLACVIPCGRRRLHSSRSSQRQGKRLFDDPASKNTPRARAAAGHRVTGTWERPSEPQQPRQEESRGGWVRERIRQLEAERIVVQEEDRIRERIRQLEEEERARDPNYQRPKTAKEAMSGPQSKLAVLAVMLAAVVFYVLNSQKVPLTGRSRFNFLSDELTARMHPKAAQTILKQIYEQGSFVLPDNDVRTQIVKNVMRRLIPVSGLTHLDWEIYVIADDSTPNAFVLPGGKVFVFSGLLKTCGNNDALAAVLGHEIAHETASHTAERMSLAWVANLTTGSLFFLVGALPGLALFAMWTVTGSFVLPALMYELPMSRTHEYEADHIGLMMMAEACYDPRAAIPFWERMNQQGIEMEEVLSTHPSNSHRIAKLEQLMPEAILKREQSDCTGTESFARRFRHAVKQKRPEMPSPQAF
ncbi:hypothetical protein PWT90_06293 [Aphanocladium album]|nr:hypothetical protein PWT90_06293 [Aphanocladium album]